MNSEVLPVIMSPTTNYIGKTQRKYIEVEEAKGGEKVELPDLIPFIQVDITQTSFDDEDYEESTRIKVFEVFLQEI
jgi:hypothetical protein